MTGSAGFGLNRAKMDKIPIGLRFTSLNSEKKCTKVGNEIPVKKACTNQMKSVSVYP